jgi:hypothetical protein
MMQRENKIRQVAHQIWREQGCPNGRAPEHWEEAEKRLRYAEVARLRAIITENEKRLGECVANLDRMILTCDRYRIEACEIQKELARLNRTLVQLGADPLVYGDGLATEDLSQFLGRRIDCLRSQG